MSLRSDTNILKGISALVNKQNTSEDVNYEEIENSMVSKGVITKSALPSDALKQQLDAIARQLQITVSPRPSLDRSGDVRVTGDRVSVRPSSSVVSNYRASDIISRGTNPYLSDYNNMSRGSDRRSSDRRSDNDSDDDSDGSGSDSDDRFDSSVRFDDGVSRGGRSSDRRSSGGDSDDDSGSDDDRSSVSRSGGYSSGGYSSGGHSSGDDIYNHSINAFEDRFVKSGHNDAPIISHSRDGRTELQRRTLEDRRHKDISAVMMNMGMDDQPTIDIEREIKEDSKMVMLEEIDSLRTALREETSVDLSRVPEVNQNTDIEIVQSTLQILRMKNDRVRYCSLADECILLGAQSLEDLFDGKNVWFGRFQPNLTDWSKTVQVKLRRMRHDTSTIVSGAMNGINLGPFWRILLELVPSMFVHAKRKKSQVQSGSRGIAGTYIRPQVSDVSQHIANIRNHEAYRDS